MSGGFFRMDKKSKQEFSDIYSIILQNITKRQWEQFLNKLRSGERISYQNFEVAKEAFYFHGIFGGVDRKDMECIKGCSMKVGNFYIHYQDSLSRT